MLGRNGLMLAVAVVLGIFAVVIANSYLTGVQDRTAQQAQRQQLVTIAVASRPLEFGTKLAPENVRLQPWPATSVPEGAYRTIDEALRGGRVALRPIVIGEPILASKVSGPDGRAVLSANLPEGQRAVTVPINNVAGVAGFARPGDVVDVLLTRAIPGVGADANDVMTTVVLEKVPVLAIDQSADEKDTAAKVGATATLQADMMGAQKLVLAQRMGSLSLVLRNVQNQMQENFAIVTGRNLPGGNLRVARGPAMAAPAYAPRGLAVPALPQFGPQFGQAGAGVPGPVRLNGPTMTIVRGTTPTSYEVTRQQWGRQ